MTVQFALFQGDDLLCRAEIRIEEHEKLEDFDYAVRAFDGITNPANPTGHLVVRHQFAIPAASLAITLVEFGAVASAAQIVLEASVVMGVHDSDDWESVALGRDYTLAFACRQESLS